MLYILELKVNLLLERHICQDKISSSFNLEKIYFKQGKIIVIIVIIN
jgi:hypothetical protein